MKSLEETPSGSYHYRSYRYHPAQDMLHDAVILDLQVGLHLHPHAAAGQNLELSTLVGWDLGPRW